MGDDASWVTEEVVSASEVPDGDVSRCGANVVVDIFRERSVCSICFSEKLGRLIREASFDGNGCDHSSTTPCIAAQISSWLVYGKQTFNIASLLFCVIDSDLSMASNRSWLSSPRCPSTRTEAPYRSRRSPCCESCSSLVFAISINASTSCFERLKFSIENA